MAARSGRARTQGEECDMSELLREVLDIPLQAGAEDYVLRLTDSIEPDGGRRARWTSTWSRPRWPRRSTRRSGWSPRR